MTIVKLLKVHFQCIFRYPELHMVIHVYVCVIDELSLIPFTFNSKCSEEISVPSNSRESEKSQFPN